MKKLLPLLLILALLLAACGSGSDADSGTSNSKESSPAVSDTLPTVLEQNEYILYQNIFFNDQADEYLGKTYTKEGTFTRLYDAFNERTRYYVWGYNDATKCCDWQWEFVPQDPEALPENGCLVKMTGTMVRDEAALDKIWFTDASLELETSYSPSPCNVDMTTMSATLERVQLLNMQYRPESFQGQSLRLYGRVLNPGTVQHPYYDNAWTQDYRGIDEAPAIGTMVIVSGTWQEGVIQASSLEGTSAY